MSYYEWRPMRRFIVVLVALMALPVAADDGFTLDLTEMDFATEKPAQTPDGVVSMVTDQIPPERAEILAFQAALRPVSGKERAQALWSSDMARVHYALAAQHAMLGREGLVNGGRMAGVGLATAGIGDGDPNGALGLALGRGKWAEMNANQRVQAGVEATLLGALLAFMISNAD